jgi:large subunit ribosomal protein L17
MPHQIYGYKLSRSKNQRQSLFKNLIRGMILYGSITTTKTKAKAIRGTVDHLITVMKGNPVDGSRSAVRLLEDRTLVKKLLHDIVPVFVGRPGGFTRMIPLGPRSSDNAPMVRIEWVEAVKSVIPHPAVVPTEKKIAGQDQAGKKSPTTATRRSGRPVGARKRTK